jgi:hypothetical protein
MDIYFGVIWSFSDLVAKDATKSPNHQIRPQWFSVSSL